MLFYRDFYLDPSMTILVFYPSKLFFNFGERVSHLCGHLYPNFGLWLTSGPDFKSRLDRLGCELCLINFVID